MNLYNDYISHGKNTGSKGISLVYGANATRDDDNSYLFARYNICNNAIEFPPL